MTGFLTSPAFIVLLAVFAVLVFVFVVWLMRDGPNAGSRRGGMVDLVGVKPRGIAWDWPSAPIRSGPGGGGRAVHADEITTDRVILGWHEDGLHVLHRVEPEPDRRPSFGV